MTQHLLEEHTDDDKQIMHRLFAVVGIFMLSSAAMAVVITMIMG